MPLLGVPQLKRNLDRVNSIINETFQQSLDNYADDLLQRSRNLAPQETGRMIATADTDKDDSRGTFRRSVFYTEPYSIFQHEGSFNPGPITAAKPGAGRKFLQRPYDASVRAFIIDVTRQSERALKLVFR